jgi:tetratricopeptide (TPR) repeat protein
MGLISSEPVGSSDTGNRCLMSRFLRATVWALLAPLRWARRRPLAAAAAALLAIVLVPPAAVWAYARHQWRAAREALATDRAQEARDRLTLPLFVWRWDADVHVLAARAARMSGDLPAAEAHLKQALKVAGRATEWVQLEFLLLRVQTGEVDEVAPDLIAVVEKGHPEAPLILSTLAVAYMHNLRYMRADACLTRWIQLDPNSAKAYQYRGWVLERLNRRREAMADYRKALELDQDLVPVRVQVAELLLEDHQPQEALPHLERLYRQVPDHPLVQSRLGMCRFLRGEFAEARRLMEAAVVQLPRDPSLLIYLAKLDLQEGRTADAERRLRAVVRADPSDTEAYYALAGVLQAQGRSDEARETLKECEKAKVVLDRMHKLLREVMDSPAATASDCAELGELLLGANQEDRGVFWLYEALDRDPENQQAHRALAAYYERKGDADRAATHRRRVRQPEAPTGSPSLGR